jgi:hypothetical protein
MDVEYEKITFTDDQIDMIEKESVEIFLIDLGKVKKNKIKKKKVKCERIG